MREQRNMLAEHGTQLMRLLPTSVLAAAREDFKRRIKNGAPDATTYEHYAFHRKHVRKAASPTDLIRRALADPGPGLQSAKYNTRLLYADQELLQAAIRYGEQTSHEP